MKPLICSADLIKKDYSSHSKETHSTSYYDFNPVTSLTIFNQECQSKRDE